MTAGTYSKHNSQHTGAANTPPVNRETGKGGISVLCAFRRSRFAERDEG